MSRDQFFRQYFSSREGATIVDDDTDTYAIVYSKDAKEVNRNIIQAFKHFTSEVAKETNRDLVFEMVPVENGFKIRW